MNKFLKWLDRNRKSIGYTCGGLNFLAAVNFYLQGQTGLALLWFVIGMFLIWDAADYKKDHA
jgi:hypothetical protein